MTAFRRPINRPLSQQCRRKQSVCGAGDIHAFVDDPGPGFYPGAAQVVLKCGSLAGRHASNGFPAQHFDGVGSRVIAPAGIKHAFSNRQTLVTESQGGQFFVYFC